MGEGWKLFDQWAQILIIRPVMDIPRIPRRPYRYIDPSSWSSRPASAPVIKSCPIQFQNTLLDALIKFQLEMCQMIDKFCYWISFVIVRLNFKQWVQNVYNYRAILHSDILFVFYSYNTRYHCCKITRFRFSSKIPFFKYSVKLSKGPNRYFLSLNVVRFLSRNKM